MASRRNSKETRLLPTRVEPKTRYFVTEHLEIHERGLRLSRVWLSPNYGKGDVEHYYLIIKNIKTNKL